MEQKLLDFCELNKIIKPGDQILVGVSGGVDSVGLLYFLCKIKTKYQLKLHCVYVDHGIREESSHEDGRFVHSLATKLGVECSVVTLDIPTLAKEAGLGIEEMARIKRYEAFKDIIARIWNSQGKVALAHHQNDQGETILFHMARGSSVSGLKGMLPKSKGLFDLELIRPFLNVSKKEIREYVKVSGLDYREDQTNQDTRYHRNLIRNEILPLMESINTKTIQHLCDLSDDIKALEAFILSQADIDWEMLKLKHSLPIHKIENLPSTIGKMIIKKTMEEMNISLKDIGRSHFQDIYDLTKKSNGKEVVLPGGLKVYRHQNQLTFQVRQERSIKKEYILLDYMDQSIELENYVVSVRLKKKNIFHNYRNDNCLFHFPYDMIDKSVVLRTWSSLDQIQVYADGRCQSLKKLYKNEKIAHQERENQWVIAKANEVYVALGIRRSEGFLVPHGEASVVEIKIERLK